MYENDVIAVSNTAKSKINFMETNLLGFFLMSMMAGFYVSFGGIFMGVIGGVMSAAGSPATKLVAGTIFSVALCMVVICGSELFTGNNFVLGVGCMCKTITWGKACKAWALCWCGNLVGSVISSVIFTLTGVPTGDIGKYFGSLGQAKMSGTPISLICKGIFCNMLVCLAVWACARVKSEVAKILMCFVCVSVFASCGFEHSVANMTVNTVALLNPSGAAVSIGGWIYNMVLVTIGNMIGGICCVALPYYLTAKAKMEQ